VSAGDLLARPDAWPALLLVPLVVVLLWMLDRLRARRLANVVGARVNALAADVRPGRRRLRRAVSGAALAFSALAVLQPIWGEDADDAAQRGVDVVVCLDVSRSMLARDVEPSRLERARREIRALAERARGDRLSLVVFAGEARIAVPLTRDVDTFLGLVELADPDGVRRGGTDLGAALSTALDAIRGGTGENETVVLLTDGEDFERRGLRAAERCRDRKIAVHCVGLGSARGAKIAIALGDERGSKGVAGETFLRDRAGNEVVTAMDPASLRAIAAATGGGFVEVGATPASDAGASPLAALYDERIAPMARKSFADDVRRGRRERGNRFQWALFPAFALWMLGLLLSDRRQP